MEQKPSIGRIVHYYDSPHGDCLAAIITAVHTDEIVSLTAFMQGGATVGFTSVMQDKIGTLSSWSWPPRIS